MNASQSKGKTSAGRLTSLTYRSRAVGAVSVDGLRSLERAAQARNHAEGLTGFVVYDDGQFFQWLEGPAESLTRVWDSVRQDGRHTDISDVTIRSTPARMFDGWDLALAIRGEEPLPAPARRTPLLSLVPRLDPILAECQVTEAWGNASTVVPFLPVLVEAVVLPQVASNYDTTRRLLPPVSPAAARLSRLLLADDAKPAARLLRRLYASAGALAPLCSAVIEPVARGIGDLWLSDDCSQFDMTMALCRLQTIVRQLNAAASPVAIGLPVVLVAPQPGEMHLLGAGLDAELLWQAGWDTHREFPATDHALQALLADTWFDVLDLSLSPALDRSDRLSSMAETICGARAASLNPALTVVVGGRAFFDQCEGTDSVGADASTMSAVHVVLTATAARNATLTKLAAAEQNATSCT